MPVTPDEFAARCRKRAKVSLREWALGDAGDAVIDLPLHPPTERAAIADLDGTLRWVNSWREAEAQLPVTISWERRRWSRAGTQDVPARVRAEGAEAIAHLAGEQARLERWSSRAGRLRASHGAVVDAALRRHLRHIGDLDEADFVRFTAAVDWLAQHPDSGMRLRELPIRGLHTKWLSGHRAAVEAVTLAATGRDGLGLCEKTDVARIRMLDPSMTVGGLRDVSAPIDELASLDLRPRAVLIVENLDTFLSLPAAPGVVAAFGRGDDVGALARIPWFCESGLHYWGDLDSHGFRILHRARAAGLQAASLLMDTRTLREHRDLVEVEPSPFLGELPLLTEPERETLGELRELGHARLEQERIAWDFALQVLRDRLAAGASSRPART